MPRNDEPVELPTKSQLAAAGDAIIEMRNTLRHVQQGLNAAKGKTPTDQKLLDLAKRGVDETLKKWDRNG